MHVGMIDTAADLTARCTRTVLEGADVTVDGAQTSGDVTFECREVFVEVRCQRSSRDEVPPGHNQQPALDEGAQRGDCNEILRLEHGLIPWTARLGDARAQRARPWAGRAGRNCCHATSSVMGTCGQRPSGNPAAAAMTPAFAPDFTATTISTGGPPSKI